ncbi:MAG: hypothetical protein NVS4B8_01160 [Herpetosiphon sp.]
MLQRYGARRYPRRRRWLRYAPVLTAGIGGATAGIDSGAIATYATTGATYGYQLLWVLALLTICVVVLQELCVRLGAVTGKGFADLLRENTSPRITVCIMSALVVANCGAIIAESLGIGAAAELFGIPRFLAVPVAVIGLWLVITRGSGDRVQQMFLGLTLVSVAYIANVFLARPMWQALILGLLTPTIPDRVGVLGAVTALVGATLTPYTQLYTQSWIVERGGTITSLRSNRLALTAGVIFSSLIAGSIIVATAATLFPKGIRIKTASDAAQALAPIAGTYATWLFGAGFLGASLLAAAVVPLATTYLVSETIGVERGVDRSWHEAPLFLGLFTVLMGVGLGAALVPGLPLLPILIGAQIVNGLLVPIQFAALIWLAGNGELMGQFATGAAYNLLATALALIVGLLSIALIATILFA